MIKRILTKDENTEVSLVISDNSDLFKFTVVDFGDRFSFALTPSEVDDLIKNLISTKEEFENRGDL